MPPVPRLPSAIRLPLMLSTTRRHLLRQVPLASSRRRPRWRLRPLLRPPILLRAESARAARCIRGGGPEDPPMQMVRQPPRIRPAPQRGRHGPVRGAPTRHACPPARSRTTGFPTRHFLRLRSPRLQHPRFRLLPRPAWLPALLPWPPPWPVRSWAPLRPLGLPRARAQRPLGGGGALHGRRGRLRRLRCIGRGHGRRRCTSGRCTGGLCTTRRRTGRRRCAGRSAGRAAGAGGSSGGGICAGAALFAVEQRPDHSDDHDDDDEPDNPVHSRAFQSIFSP